jgi:hypothetical protein
MVNDRDQALLRSAVSDAAANLSEFVPSLSTCEVLAFGEGVALPARLIFRQLPHHLLPRNETLGVDREALTHASQEFLASVLERWRGATMSGKPNEPAGPQETRAAMAAADAPPLQPAGPAQKPIPPRSSPPSMATSAFPSERS